MTVSYNLTVSNVNSSTWLKLLFRWRGSIWKSVAQDLAIWIFFYYVIMTIYRSDWFLDEEGKIDFEHISMYLNSKLEYIPLTFMLGFFVTLVVSRWRQIFQNIGWIENSALTISCLIRGNDPQTTLTRRAIVRYLVLTQILVFRDISIRVRRRFPNMESIVKAGFLQKQEKKKLKQIDCPYNTYWAPINWALALTFKMREQGKITSEPSLMNVINEIKSFRTNLALLCNFDWAPLPLAYPQVVFLAVRVYFLICLVGRQFILGNEAENKSVVDAFFPFMTVLQFIFFVGWMKVAEALLNPMGEDDDDFECNFLIDKNISTGLAIVDDEYDDVPELIMDSFKTSPAPLYSKESRKHEHPNEIKGSVADVKFSESFDDVSMGPLDQPKEENARTPTLRNRIGGAFSFKRLSTKSRNSAKHAESVKGSSVDGKPAKNGATHDQVIDIECLSPITAKIREPIDWTVLEKSIFLDVDRVNRTAATQPAIGIQNTPLERPCCLKAEQ